MARSTSVLTSSAAAQCVSNQSCSWATSRPLCTWMFNSTFRVSPGLVKLLDPTSACAPTTSNLAWGDVCLGVELVPPINPTLDPALSDGLHHSLYTLQERVRALLVLQTVIESTHTLAQRLLEHIVGSQRHLVAYQQADPLQLLPLAVEGQQRPDLEEPGGDVE